MDLLPACTVRAAEPSDLEFLVQANQSLAFESEGLRLDAETVTRGVQGVFDDQSRGRYLIAEREGVPQGSLLVTREWSDWNAGYYWWIASVYTAPEARRTGVYRSLYRRVLEEARGSGDVVGVRLYVERANRTAQTVYENLGMASSGYLLYETGL